MPRHRIAIYDLDRTITRRATWTRFLLFAIRRRAPWRALLIPFALAAATLNALGLLDRRGLKQAMHRLALGSMAEADAERLATDFARICEIRADACTQIATDRAAGYRIVLATAAYRFYAAALADAVGADALIATRAVRQGDRILPVIDGDNLYGPAKLAAILGWLHDEGIGRADAHVRFYTDHISDLPTLDWADDAFAVVPSPPLRRVAIARGWRILDWR